jgi:hypothetical protein
MDDPAKTPDSSRAKRVLVLAALLFVTVQLAVGLALDRAPLRVRFHEADAALRRVRALGPTPDVLLFGSSRFRELILPDEVEARLRERLGERAPRVTSLAFNGGDLVGSEIMLEHVLASGARPRMALIELTPEWLQHPVPVLNGQLLRAFTWRDVGAWLPELLLGTRRTLICARLFPVYCYRDELLTWATGRPPPYLVARPSPSQAPPRAKRDDPKHGARRWARRMRNYSVSPRALHVLERVLERCREAQVHCVFVESPVTSFHRAMLDGHIESIFRGALERVQEKSPIEFIDLSARLPDDGFRDSTHGNHSGADRFSAIFADEVIEPRWFAR